MPEAFEIISDCGTCLVEGAVVELHDPGAASGIALRARCRCCGGEERLGKAVKAGRRPASVEEARAALSRWAVEEGEEDLGRFCEGSFLGLSADAVCEALVAGQPVGTSFDVMAWLFAGSGAPRGAEVRASSGEGPQSRRPMEISEAPTRSGPPELDPPARIARALISTMLADGTAGVQERAFVDRVLAEQGLPPWDPADLRVWRPLELGRPANPAPLIETLAELCWVDGQRDDSEWRVVREYARAWGYPMGKLVALDRRLERSRAPWSRRLWLTVRGLFILEQT